eukprot:gnl/Chilomastix_caulleri/4826.p2 GENE.gnl/Chilomastix_caulleri/4826~~gnl/Chilomastix_caulleri/4826.p2  ORF type:complete len:82 (-),score=20.31 gnl/Chilomastix_caulleri/4826:268-513(-)
MDGDDFPISYLVGLDRWDEVTCVGCAVCVDGINEVIIWCDGNWVCWEWYVSPMNLVDDLWGYCLSSFSFVTLFCGVMCVAG